MAKKTDGGGAGVMDAPAAAAAEEGAAQVMRDVDVRRIVLTSLAESPHNPRKYFHQRELVELGENLLSQGQLMPVLVRPHPSNHGVYELAAGHRRFRAAKLIGWDSLLCIVQEMDDETFLKAIVTDNRQRENLHPLEEAEGYADLIKTLRWDVPRIAREVNKSETYVYDRLTFLKLIAPAKQLFLENRMTAAHATELSRLEAGHQKDAIDPHGDALWEYEDLGHLSEEEELALDTKKDPYAELKPRSLREFRTWIRETVHWGEEIRAAKKAATAGSNGTGKSSANSWEEQERKRREARDAANAQVARAIGPITKAFEAAVRKAPLATLRPILTADLHLPKPAKGCPFPEGKTADEFLRHVAWVRLVQTALEDDYNGAMYVRDAAKELGVNIEPLIKAAQPKEEASAKGAAKAAPATKGKATAKAKSTTKKKGAK